MLIPEVRDGIMFFPRVSSHLDGGIFTLGWRILDDRTEPWTQRFDRFKYNNAPAIRGASKVLPAAFHGVLGLPAQAVLVSAIPSAETRLPRGHALSTLGTAVAGATGWQWMPGALSKKKHRRLVDLGHGDERDAEVKDVYAADLASGHLPDVVILDDFVTRGATLGDAARALRAASRGVKRVYGLAIGKNERRSWASQCGVELSNDHLSQELRDMWDSA